MKRDLPLLLGWLTGPIVFGLEFLVSYMTVSVTSTATETPKLLAHVFSLVALLLTVGAGLLAFRDRNSEDHRVRFMAWGGAAMSAFFAIVIVAHAIPAFMLKMGE